jgi:glycine/D-amino acid oxidase-like deaminating enzyme
MRMDTTTPDTRLSDDPLSYNPAAVGALTQLMLGGLPPRHGEPLHCRLRYFDPLKRRAGIPEDVAALVEKLTDDEATLTLVNINQVEARTVVVQAGAYAEHQITNVAVDDRVAPVDSSSVTIRLAPGAGSRMVIRMKRYANQPTFTFPWDRG